MKKLILSFAVAMLCVPATAQQYIIVDNETPILASDVDKITYEQDEQFSSSLLPSVLAADPKAQLFSGALQATGIAEMLNNYQYDGCQAPADFYPTALKKYWYNTSRNKMFTVFVETDEALAVLGISNINQLKAYAKKVYDAVYPEDADISDPKDPRNSFNRFMAYHILPFGCNYWNLTYYDGKQTDKVVDTDMTDIAVWYGTVMSNASLKCSYPMGADSGVYLNRRGLKDGPDKYGKQIRGAKIVSDGSNSSDPFTHQAFNGYYFYIDRMLVYDKTTQEDVLGSELWRVDFKALSPDIMNNAEDLRGNFYDSSDNTKNGKNYAYSFNCLENITAENTTAPLLASRAISYYSTYLCDEVWIPGTGGIFTIKLPPLPPGEWEIRMGTSAQDVRPHIRVSLNGQVTIDSLDLTLRNYNPDMFFGENPFSREILDYMEKNYFEVTQQGDDQYLVTDLKTGEKILLGGNPHSAFSSYDNILYFIGTDPSTGTELDWTERANTYRQQATNDYITIANLPKVMKAPDECMCDNGGSGSWLSLSHYAICVRYPLGRITTDGKTDNYLRIESLSDGKLGTNNELAIDYLEFVPKPIYDNE